MNPKYYSALAVSAAAVGMVLFTSTQASAQLQDPQPRRTSQPAQNVAPDWPDESSGYPAPAKTKVAPDWPDEGTGFPKSVEPTKGYRYAPSVPDYALAHPKSGEPTKGYNYSNYDPKYEVARTTTAAAASSRDDTTAEWLQSGASALGGAAVALSCVWLYRRHQLHAA